MIYGAIFVGLCFGFILGAIVGHFLVPLDEAEYINSKHESRKMTKEEEIDFDTYFNSMDEFFGEFDELFKKFPRFKSKIKP